MTELAIEAQPVSSRAPSKWSINSKRALTVYEITSRHYENSLPPYNQPHWILPEDSIELPEKIREDRIYWARFLFWACMFMRGKIKSVQAMRRLLKLYAGEAAAGRPDILDPYVALELPEEYIRDVLKQYGLYGSFARGWQINASRMIERYQGNILLAFYGIASYAEVCRIFCNNSRTKAGFWGFQKKMASMIIYFLVEARLIQSIPAPPPVDWHHISLAWRVGVVDLLDNTLDGKDEIDFGACEDLRDVYVFVMWALGISPIDMARSPWLHSAYLCSAAPGNQLEWRGDYEARSTAAVYSPPDWDDAKNVEDWLKTCGICPLRAFCTKLAPSSQWYDWGKLGAIWTERTEPTKEQIAKVVLFNPHELAGNQPKSKPKAAPSTVNNEEPSHQEELFA